VQVGINLGGVMDLGCSCSCDFDGEPVEVFTSRIVKARKEHKCSECSEAIKKGERHLYYTSKCEGEWFTDRSCLVCVAIAEDLCCGKYSFGGLRDMLIENCGFDYTKHVE
jgi:hypothetical protein